MFEADDLIFDQRTLEGLGNLYNSLVRPFFTVTMEAMASSEFEEFTEN